jgi:hypothetical protein
LSRLVVEVGEYRSIKYRHAANAAGFRAFSVEGETTAADALGLVP